MLFKEALQRYWCYLRRSHFDGKSINEFPVKSPVLNLEDIEWKNLFMHYSYSQDVPDGSFLQELEEEFWFEKNDRMSQI